MNSFTEATIPYAFSKQLNRLVGVNEVERGLTCNCICPSCKMELEAIQGEVRLHHFRHYNKAKINCTYSYWVSIRNLAKQLLRNTQFIKCKDIPVECETSEKKADGFYEIELLEEEKVYEKHGMDIFFMSNIGLIGIYFTTPENRNKESAGSVSTTNSHHILEVDLNLMKITKSFTVDALQKLIKDPNLKSFVLLTSVKETMEHKNQEDFIIPFFSNENSEDYDRLYRAKSIMNMEDFHAMKLNTLLINSFVQNDFSAINVAKLYYKNMLEQFWNAEISDSCKEIHDNGLHSFYKCKDQYYGVAVVQSKYHIYQVVDDKIILIDKCFKKEKIAQILMDFLEKIDAEDSGSETINKYSTLF